MKRLINLQPSSGWRLALGIFPFVLLLALYLLASDARLADNPNDKLLPSLTTFADSIQAFAVEPNSRTGKILLWGDTLASLKRLALGLGVSALAGLVFGVLTGSIPLARSGLSPLIRAVSLIPPMAILPVLFIVFGLDELSKVVLIVIGIAPLIMRDLQQRVQEIPTEQLIKAQTLGGNSWQIILRVVLPQILPRLIDSVRLQLGCAWLFLISAEAIAATDGLGYRIFLVRRYMSMDIILPYVLWITLLAYLTDWLLRRVSQWAFPWFESNKADA